MIVETGHFALILALFVALVQATVPMLGAARRNPGWMDVGRSAALTQFLLIAVAMGALMHAYIVSDFSVINVIENSHSRQAAAVQNLRRVGQPRGLDAAVGVHARPVRRRGGGCSAATCRRRCGRACWRCRA